MSKLMNITKENFEKEVLNSKLPVIMDFWAEWCGPCKMMGPVFEELGEEYKNKVKFVKVNTEIEQELPGQFQIQGIPSLVIMSNKKEVDRIVGFAPKDVLKQKIDKIIGVI